jgi:hypothetical protein
MVSHHVFWEVNGKSPFEEGNGSEILAFVFLHWIQGLAKF